MNGINASGSLALHGIALFCYLLSSVFYGANLAIRKSANGWRGRILFLIGLAVNTVAIGAYCLETHQSPFASSYGTLAVASWIVALFYLPLELSRRVASLGALAIPVCCLLLFTAILRSQTGMAAEPLLRSRVVSMHVLLILVSFAFFALAACCALLYVWQYSQLKQHRRSGLFRRLPPLETVDRLAYHLVAFALPMLTLGIGLGIVRAWGQSGAWVADAKTIVSFVAWTVYGVYLVARLAAGWRGSKLNYMLVAGLVVTIALYFVPSATHRFSQSEPKSVTEK